MKPATQNPDQSSSPNLRSAYIYKGCRLFSCRSLWWAGFTVFLQGRQCLQLFLLCGEPDWAPSPSQRPTLIFPPFSKETYPCWSARRSNSSARHRPPIFKMQCLHCFCLFLSFYFCQVPFCINLCHALSNLKLQCTISLWKHCPCLLWLRDCAHLFCSLNALSLTSNLANTHGSSISRSHCDTVFSFLAQTGLLPNVSTVCLTRYTRSALKTGTLVCPSYTSLYTDIISHIRWTLGNVYIYIDVC